MRTVVIVIILCVIQWCVCVFFFSSGMFDRDMSGTIDLSEFQSLWHYIQQWRSTFERYDSNRSGSIEGNELQAGKTFFLYMFDF